jgi:hypothetical protein
VGLVGLNLVLSLFLIVLYIRFYNKESSWGTLLLVLLPIVIFTHALEDYQVITRGYASPVVIASNDSLCTVTLLFMLVAWIVRYRNLIKGL